MSIVTNYSLLPLLFTPELLIIKLSLFLLYAMFTIYCTSKIYKNWETLLPIYEQGYILGFIVVFVYENFIQYLFGLNVKMPFLPLLLTSFYCSLGVIYFWVRYYFWFMMLKNSSHKITIKSKQKKRK